MFNIQNLRVEEGIPQVVYDMREDGHGLIPEKDSHIQPRHGRETTTELKNQFKQLLVVIGNQEDP